MLKHEDNSETPSQSAAKVRVTPQELTAALARLEARQGGLDGTIPLGDAVQELGLNTTPEELLREIEAGRARSQENYLRTPVPIYNRLRVGVICALALLLSGGMVYFLRMSVPSPPATISPAVAITLPAPQAIPKPISLAPNLLVRDASGKIVMLSEVGDNRPVHCLYDNGRFQDFSTDSQYPWTLIKHGGQVYVRGLIPHMSDQALQKTGTDVSTGDPYGGDVHGRNFISTGLPSSFVVPVTLPLNGFRVYSAEDTAEGAIDSFHAYDLHLDKHAYEKWQP